MPLDASRIQYIALDLDGTLLRTDKSISDRTRLAVERAESQGYVPIVATARPPRTAETFLEGFVQDAPRVYYSGSRVCIGNDCLINRTIPTSTALHIVDTILGRFPKARVGVEIDDRLYANQLLGNAHPDDILDVRTVLDQEPVKIMLDLSTPGIPEDILYDLPPVVRYVASDGGWLAQIMHRDVSKSDGIGRVVGRNGRSLSEVIAFGDDTNDVEMIREAGIGVAMANAVDPVKSVADHVTLSNDEDGVAVVIEGLLLG